MSLEHIIQRSQVLRTGMALTLNSDSGHADVVYPAEIDKIIYHQDARKTKRRWHEVMMPSMNLRTHGFGFYKKDRLTGFYVHPGSDCPVEVE
ncbi:hypothetical protein ACJ72_04322 [Emergomyces africanus]|uniref:Uncharacterized protein n=1 Tax=Emergomyces africanus TaxID=1955775 RepID=A0A1B7NXJ9_9EURO|nr:hypothetical protein ACJ72_04322 [Emergomyces africanus]